MGGVGHRDERSACGQSFVFWRWRERSAVGVQLCPATARLTRVLHAFYPANTTTLARWTETLTLPSDRVTFFNFLASHDGIGINPVRGILTDSEIDARVSRAVEHGGFVSYKQNTDKSASPYELNINYLDALANPNDSSESVVTPVNRFMTAQAIMLSLVGVPGIYFYSLFGSRGDRAGAETAGIPRRVNRQKLMRAELECELGDPDSLRAQVFARYTEQVRVRRAHRAFDPHAEQHIVGCDPRVFAILRVASDQRERVLCLHNVANQTVSVRLAKNADGESWLDLTNGRIYAPDVDDASVLTLQPYQTIWAIQQNGVVPKHEMTRTKTQINYDRLSRWYDLFAHASEKKYVDAGLRMLNIQEGESVLEIGFGTGHSIVALAQAVGKSGKVYGVDISEGMRRVAQARVNKARLAKRVVLEHGDAKTLSFAGNRFDAIFMSFTLELFDPTEIPVVLDECRRTLRRNGRLGIVALSRKEKPGRMVQLYEWIRARFPEYVDCHFIGVFELLTHSEFQMVEVTEKTIGGLPVAILLAKK